MRAGKPFSRESAQAFGKIGFQRLLVAADDFLATKAVNEVIVDHADLYFVRLFRRYEKSPQPPFAQEDFIGRKVNVTL